MGILRMRLAGIATASLLAAAAALMSGGSVAAASSYTCTGGSIPGGTYSSVFVKGPAPCTVDAGNVSVTHSLVVGRSAVLNSAFASSNLSVLGNLVVRPKGILVLGCEPDAFPCFDDSSSSNSDWVGGNLTADHALAMLVHHAGVAHSIYQTHGGGGMSCSPLSALGGSPAYSTYEDVTVGGNVTIFALRSCWLGVIRTQVHGSVVFVNNVLGDPDGNEIVTNVIGGDLFCYRNSPKPQVGDSTGSPNIVGGRELGQCAHLDSL